MLILGIDEFILWPVKNQNRCAHHGNWKKGQSLGVINCSCGLVKRQWPLVLNYLYHKCPEHSQYYMHWV